MGVSVSGTTDQKTYLKKIRGASAPLAPPGSAYDTDIGLAIGKYPIGQTPFFQEDISFCEVSKIGPIITLLPLNHRIDFRGDSELQVAVKFGAVNFRREL